MTSKNYIVELPDGSFSETTLIESKLAQVVYQQRIAIEQQIAELKKTLEQIRSSCSHPVVYDEVPDGPACGGYTSRICPVCGHISLL